MAIRKFRTGQMSYNALTYVGTAGTLFYDEDNGALRISDGVTPGGSLISYPIASSSQIGGVKLGPGVILNGDGQIIIDSEGLDFSFGNLAATVGTYPADYYQAERQDLDYAVLGSIITNEDIVLASNGTGAVRVVGDFSVRRANGSLIGALEEEPIFRVKSDGQVQLLVPAADSAEGAFTIVGGLEGVFQAPVNTGVMMHITGIASSPDPTPSRIYNDAQNSFGAFVTRRYNGTAAAPTAVLDGEEILRLSGTAHNGTLIPGTGNQRIIYKALGNQTLTNQGGTMEFWATPINTTTLAKIATVSSTGITLESGKVLTGNVTGNVSGTAATVTTAAQPAITSVGTLTSLTVTNAISGGSVSDSIGNVRSVPINGQSGAYNLAATDNGKMISITTGGVSVLQNVFADPYGQIISIYNNSNTSQTITQGAGVTLRLAGTAATGNRTLARYGVATITCVAANTFVISGAGIT
jgi:hypothetical protein